MSVPESNLASREMKALLKVSYLGELFPKKEQFIYQKYEDKRPVKKWKNLNMFISYQYFKNGGLSSCQIFIKRKGLYVSDRSGGRLFLPSFTSYS